MSHTHPVRDDDLRFVIDPSTRAITNKAGGRTTIMQGDHNSEIFTFEFPRVIEGHDMTLCNVVEVHYDNIGVGTSVSTRQTNSGVYKMTDLASDKDDNTLLTCSWRVTDEATQLYGTIEFALKFVCYDTDDSPGYVLNTDICKTIDVKQSKNNNNAVYERDPDLYRQLDERVSDLETSGIPDADVEAALKDYLNENQVFELDTTLSKSGEAADAKAVGDKFAQLEQEIENAGSDIAVDTTMSISGAAADAKVVGEKLLQLEKSIPSDTVDVDPNLNISGAAADAKVVGDKFTELEEAIENAGSGSNVEVDDTLSVSGKAADAKAVGDELEAIREEIANIEPGSGETGEATLPYSYGTEDLTAGISELETGKLYFVYE